MSRYSDIVLADSPALYWALDVTNGATDLSGNSYNGTGGGGVSIGGYQGSPVYDETLATDFDGVDDRVSSSYNPFANSTVRTYWGWANRDNQSTLHTLFSGSNGSLLGPWLVLQSASNDVQFRVAAVDSSSASQATWTAAWPGNDQWVLWALVFDESADTATLYINGTSKGSVSGLTQTYQAGSNLVVGALATSTLPFDGKMAYVGVTTRALSSSDLTRYWTAARVQPWAPRVRENPPLRLSVNVQPPSGQPSRWARDEPKAANVPSGLTFTSTAPGGFESCNLTLPRRPKLSYPDLERLSTVTVRGAGGQIAWEGRIEATPRDSGDQMAVSPQMVGWQAHLEDNKNARALYVDRDLGNWKEPSRARQVSLRASNLPPTGSVASATDTNNGLPSLQLSVSDTWASPYIPVAEGWYDAGAGLTVASVYDDFSGDANTGFILLWISSVADDATTEVSSDIYTAATGSGTRTPSTPRRYWAYQWKYNATTAGIAGYQFAVDLRRLTVWGSGATKRGTAPDDGVYASDVVAHALSNFAPLLSYSTGANGTVTDSSFIIPQLAFKDPTTAAEIIAGANRFHLRDWFVWEGSRAGQPTFYYHDRGARGKSWRARVGPSGLSETGQSMGRLWNGVIVRYQDVDGTTKTVGPTGALADSTSASLIDTDPLNPANKLGINRWTTLDMNGVSTVAGATEVGRRFLVETKALDTSGRADIQGYVQDDRGTLYPAWRIRAGDTIVFTDAADASSRRVIRTSYDDSTKVCSIDLDAPPESLDSLLERLQVVLVGIT